MLSERLTTWSPIGLRSTAYGNLPRFLVCIGHGRLIFLLFALVAPCRLVPAAQGDPGVTFNKDIAPLVFEHCAACHRPGQSAPFSLLTYAEVKKRGKQITELTARHYMPPWLPSGAVGEFVGDRRLSETQILLFQRWFEAGTPEGASADLPSPPHWREAWQLGTPDLVLEMPLEYTLAADGRDVYRNFVIPVSLTFPKHVRAVEFRPNNPRIVHHAFVKVDHSGSIRQLDGADGQPGFAGMNLPESVAMPEGHFLSWQPGKTPSFDPPGFGWTLRTGEDLVLQTHLRPSGKPEVLKAQLGFYFTDIAPSNSLITFPLCSLNIDIPPGTNAYQVEGSLVLPVECDLLAVLPHTHYLGKRLEGSAVLPDGRRRALLRIPDWDFNWQGDYRYSHPMRLPAGTTLQMRYLYDNSAANPRNPNQPPKAVRYGPETSDEMAELWFQVRLMNTNDAARLTTACNEKQFRLFRQYAEFRLAHDSHDAQARTELGFIQWRDGEVSNALESFHLAVREDPAYDQPHYYLGVVYRTQNRLPEARTEFETAIRLNAKNAKAFGNLAFVYMSLNQLDQAETNMAIAARLDPTDKLSRESLQNIRLSRKNAPAVK
jgi:Flp pilus assembly protein TadD